MTSRCEIRGFLRRDLPMALRLETESFDYPWTEEDFARQLRWGDGLIAAGPNEQVWGYAVFHRGKKRIHLTNLAVHKEHRRHRIATALLDRIRSYLLLAGPDRMVAIVREANIVAQLFLRHHGFAVATILENKHPYTGEAAYVMQYSPRKPMCCVRRWVYPKIR